jgi:hypothetical protein
MFLSLKKTVRELPEQHALAYARAKDDRQFGRIIRGEVEQPPATASKRAKKTAAIETKAVARKGSAKGSNPLASGQVGECIFGFSAIQPRSCRRFPEVSC